MPSDDYASVGGGGVLKLKGGKVQKLKKKTKKKEDKSVSSNLERSLSAQPDLATLSEPTKPRRDDAARPDKRHGFDYEDADEHKTEAERRHEEANKKKMLKMLQDPKLSSDLRKTHKERVEGLNTYLSKLSEHHDMPKIGPG
ncbi:hypothetical protein F4809DRAFT_654650 [Biscogniauxia mediterranea]|nr:hypothetical protein F4809DRAFT_654650 [Biscogniauxia mediterranea]